MISRKGSGVVLSVLEPTGSDEEILRGLAIRGTQTSSHVYYEHIEVEFSRHVQSEKESIVGMGAPFWIEFQ